MNRNLVLLSLCVLAGSLVSLPAAVRQGQQSTIVADTIDAGGGISSSAKAKNLGSIGGIGGVSTSASARVTAQHGYPPQVELRLLSSPMSVARAKATCRSVVMRPFAGLIQGDSNTNYVTTFDGSSAQPNTNVLSQESRPRAGQPGAYEADYLTYNSAGVLWQYGAFTTILPATDADQNTIPDLLQLDRSGDTTVTGQSTPDWPTTIPAGAIQGQMRRNADSLLGTYDLILQNAFATVNYIGLYSLVYFEFEIGYLRGATNRLQFTHVVRASDLFTNLLAGDCLFTVTSQDQIQLAQFTLTNRDGTSYTILPSTLNRSGRQYLGQMQLADGNLKTPWPDFTQWVLELTDDADRDQDGIPDLSDKDEPPADRDGDGMPDEFELAHQLNPSDPADAALDSDGDGHSNLLEYWAGTDPRDPNSVLRLAIEVRDGFCYLSFLSQTNRIYRFEQCPDLGTQQWQTLFSGMMGTGQQLGVSDTNAIQSQRYYRIWVTPNR